MKLGKKIFYVSVMATMSLTGCGGGGSTSSSNTNGPVSLAGVVVTPNLGPVSGNVTVTAIDLTTNKILGSSSTQNADGSFTISKAGVKNPVIIKVTGGQYLDEASGKNRALPTSGISACLPDASQTTNVAVTPITEIATQAALKAGTVTAAGIDAANKNVGSALLNGADPTTTIPVDISLAAPQTATTAQKNYARVLAGLAVVAKNSGQDLYAAAQAFSANLFDAYGQPALSTGGALPANITNLQAATNNYKGAGSIGASTVPAADPYAVIGLVNHALTSSKPARYSYMQVILDPYTAGQGQAVKSMVILGTETPDLRTGISQTSAFAAYVNGSAVQSFAVAALKGTHSVSRNPYGQIIVTVPAWNQKALSPVTFDFSKDGEFAVGQQIADNGLKTVLINILVKKPTTAPTVASVKGKYHLFLIAHNSSSNAPMMGYTEHHLLTLDGKGNATLVGVNNDQSSGVVVTSLIKSSYTYKADAHGVLLSTGNRLIFSANGQYALYAQQSPGLQEWGVAIKDHANNISFSSMNKAIIFDTHSQGLNMGNDWHKGINYAKMMPSTVKGASPYMVPVKAFIPAQVAPNLYCGTAATPGCGAPWPALFQPLKGTGNAAINGEFKFNDVSNGIADPNAYIGDGYISVQGDVRLIEDRGNALVIGLGR